MVSRCGREGRFARGVLPKILVNVGDDGDFTPGATTKRDYGVTTVPEHFAK